MLVISLVGIILLIVIYFIIPYSKLKNDFNRKLQEERMICKGEKELLTEEMMENLPVVVRRFYNYAGYIGKPQFTELEMYNKNADFVLDIETSKPIKISYTEVIFAKPVRLAFIDTKLYGIPFQGLDQYVDQGGSMRGVLAKSIEMFNVKGKEMDESALATWLCVAIFLPKAMFDKDLQWQQIDDNTVKVTLNEEKLAVSATYEFDGQGRLLSTTTDNRSMTEKDGSFIRMRWCVALDEYEEVNGYYLPQKIKCMWQREDEDLVYFDSSKAEFIFR